MSRHPEPFGRGLLVSNDIFPMASLISDRLFQSKTRSLFSCADSLHEPMGFSHDPPNQEASVVMRGRLEKNGELGEAL